MSPSQKKKGPAQKDSAFTLIELLVVIAIIGLLSAIILASLQSARKRGSDTRVVADVQQIRNILSTGQNSSVYTDLYGATAGSPAGGSFTISNSGYTAGSPAAATTTAASANLATQWNDAVSQGGAIQIFVGTNSTTGGVASPNVISFAIYGQLVSSTKYFCIDSTGNTNPSAIAHSSSTCPTAGN